MKLNKSWTSVLIITLLNAGFATAKENEPTVLELQIRTMNEADSKQMVCSLYKGYQSFVTKDSVMAKLCDGHINLNDLNPNQLDELHSNIKTLGHGIEASSGSTAI